MSVAAFSEAPEVRVAVTHLYLAPVPLDCFEYGEKPDTSVYALQVSATHKRVSVAYMCDLGSASLFTLEADADDLQEQFAFAVWRELAGHVIPYAVYSHDCEGFWLKLASHDEARAPRHDFKHPAWCV